MQGLSLASQWVSSISEIQAPALQQGQFGGPGCVAMPMPWPVALRGLTSQPVKLDLFITSGLTGEAEMSAASQWPLTPPCRLWGLREAPSAASVGSVANTFTLCSGTWLTAASTTGAASGMGFRCMWGIPFLVTCLPWLLWSSHLSSTGDSTVPSGMSL